eukprot:TRINITY_DN95107_c0_g1_i1.p1 TRINITY_DN95107_c0_g1~~TRINITY_DN95107_c0_g1_i1.p1  ORF type:complete len:113 (-),score=8.67 TRINITY_DN95107_c0_g1_i1:47-385(-)
MGVCSAKDGRNYHPGEVVQVLSSRHGWVRAKVLAIHRNGTCDCQYLGSIEQKSIPLDKQAQLMKKDAASAGGALLRAALVNPQEFQPPSPVKVHVIHHHFRHYGVGPVVRTA